MQLAKEKTPGKTKNVGNDSQNPPAQLVSSEISD
jgi:hypothetical protein